MNFLHPDWPAPPGVRALVSSRAGGVSQGAYASLNLGDHVGDEADHVAENRRRFTVAAGLSRPPAWLRQVHGCEVLCLQEDTPAGGCADACWTNRADTPCTVLTADCLPVLFAAEDGSAVAAAHAGWRGLAAGVLEETLRAMAQPAGRLIAWLGPAIGPTAFQVGAEVRASFLAQAPDDATAFTADGERWRADLYALARARLARAGLARVYGGDLCTASDPQRFFSHRRDGVTGRQAALIWID